MLNTFLTISEEVASRNLCFFFWALTNSSPDSNPNSNPNSNSNSNPNPNLDPNLDPNLNFNPNPNPGPNPGHFDKPLLLLRTQYHKLEISLKADGSRGAMEAYDEEDERNEEGEGNGDWKGEGYMLDKDVWS